MIAAIYARKSTDDDRDKDDPEKSVTRQIENARAFALEKGWTVDDRLIFADDKVSGAETTRLVNKQKMIELIVGGACPFQALVMQAHDRLSRRDGDESFGELKRLAQHVEVWFYADRKQFTYGTFESNVTGMLQGEFAAQFRRIIQQKTAEAMLRKAKAGYVTGGKVFGYDNVRLNGHVERHINPAEAAVVRDIYARYDHGDGFKQIAHALNAKRVPSPRPQRGRPAGWEPSTVRAVLRRVLYRGTISYNKTRKRDRDGSRVKGRQPRKPEAEWVTVDAPQLRLIAADLAERVDARLAGRRDQYLRTTHGRLIGRPRGSSDGKHLLAGFLVCECGATFEAVKNGRHTFTYVCSARRRKGPDVCRSEEVLPLADIETTFLDVIDGSVLHPDFIDRVVDAVFAADPDDERVTLEQERARLVTEITNLTAVAAAGGDVPTLAKALAERDRKLKSLDAKLLRPTLPLPDRDRLRAALQLRGDEWRDVLRSRHVPQARLVLQHLINLPLRIMSAPMPPHVKVGTNRSCERLRPTWHAETRPGGLLVGYLQKIQNLASPHGTGLILRQDFRLILPAA